MSLIFKVNVKATPIIRSTYKKLNETFIPTGGEDRKDSEPD